jgi:DnaK suppressor protein
VDVPGTDHLVVMKDILLEERERLVAEVVALAKRERDVSVNQRIDDGGTGGDSADVATELFEQELALGLAQHVRSRLSDLDDALTRIENGEYGLCADCGEAINPERLRALPQARRCVGCQQQQEYAARTGRSNVVAFAAAANRKPRAQSKPVVRQRRAA